MDLFTWVNSTASTATTTVHVLLMLIITVVVAVFSMRKGFSIAALAITGFTAAIMWWLTMGNGIQVLGKMIGSTVS